MARFFGTGIVWDGEKNRRLCKFINGEYITKDEKEKKILIKSGFDFDDDDEIICLDDNNNPIEMEEIVEEEYGYAVSDGTMELEDGEEIIEVAKPKSKPLHQNSVKTLKAMCKKKGYTGYYNLDKKGLIKFIQEKEVK